jgi:hypothetical protein
MSYSKGSVGTTTTRRISYSDIGVKKNEFLNLFSKYLSNKGYIPSIHPVAPHLVNLEFEQHGFNLYYARPALRVDKKGNDLTVRLLTLVTIKTVLATLLPDLIDLLAFLYIITNPSLHPMAILPLLIGIFLSIFIVFTTIPFLILYSDRRRLLKSLEEVSETVASELGGVAMTPFTTSYETLTPISLEGQVKPRTPFTAQIKFERTAMVLSWINPICAGIYMHIKYRESNMQQILLSLLLGIVQAYMLFIVLTTISSTEISLLGLASIAFAALISLTRVFPCPNCGKEVQVKKQKCPYCNAEL